MQNWFIWSFSAYFYCSKPTEARLSRNTPPPLYFKNLRNCLGLRFGKQYESPNYSRSFHFAWCNIGWYWMRVSAYGTQNFRLRALGRPLNTWGARRYWVKRNSRARRCARYWSTNARGKNQRTLRCRPKNLIYFFRPMRRKFLQHMESWVRFSMSDMFCWD